MIQLIDLKICESCGNAFAKYLNNKAINRCPACKTWKIEDETKEWKTFQIFVNSSNGSFITM